MRNFFVETCDLVWNEESGKHVALRQELCANATLFVRLLQPERSAPAHPVVYEAELLGKTRDGLQQIRLNAVSPR